MQELLSVDEAGLGGACHCQQCDWVPASGDVGCMTRPDGWLWLVWVLDKEGQPQPGQVTMRPDERLWPIRSRDHGWRAYLHVFFYKFVQSPTDSDNPLTIPRGGLSSTNHHVRVSGMYLFFFFSYCANV